MKNEKWLEFPTDPVGDCKTFSKENITLGPYPFIVFIKNAIKGDRLSPDPARRLKHFSPALEQVYPK